MSSSSSFNIPTYSLISSDKDIEYSIYIPDLTVNKKFFGPNLPENGKIECEILETGFNFKFVGSKELTNKDYRLVISKFPCKIFPNKSSWKCRNGAIDVKLRVSANPKEVEAKLLEEAMTEDIDPLELKQ
ncbi:unnamed protein product [Rodentolepis nana]|uniref:CS domain-containing protein n=1 Tax=Rodentolepis nana TaxID=102285 RepID=A0A0R3TMD1_RODNA|nr:unnamed protein product [Rodentolepis nana]